MRNLILRRLVLIAAAVACAAAPAPAQQLTLDLAKGLKAQAAGETVEAKLGAGAKLIRTTDGAFAQPGPKGSALIVPVPSKLWKAQGTLSFQMRLSRTIRWSDEKPVARTDIARCPLFTLSLLEHRKHVVLSVRMMVEGEETKALRRGATRGRLFWSHLKADKTYNLAFTWNADTGRIDVYLNGQIQQEIRLRDLWREWPEPAKPAGPLVLGGVLAPGTKREAKVSVGLVRLYDHFMNEQQVAASLKGVPNYLLAGEGCWDLPGKLDLKPYRLKLVYKADFSKPLKVVAEDKLFATEKHEKRARLPEGDDWVLEGEGKAWTKDGRCIVRSADAKRPSHLVLWNTREFPADFLLEFSMSPINSRIGLAIIFFNTRGLNGESPFALNMPYRGGVFRNYHHGPFNGYHCSYWATNPGAPGDNGILRRTTNLRKNSGFYMPACGIDRIGGAGDGPHRVRLLKVGPRIQVEARGRMALDFVDDGKAYGPVWTHPGWIGLRQMGHSRQVSYSSFKVWQVTKK